MLHTEIIRTIIVAIGWTVLLGGTVYLFMKGSVILRAVEDSILGRLAKVVMVSMILGTYSLGIVSTAFLYTDLPVALNFVVPIFIIWLVMIFWAMRGVARTADEVHLS